MKQLMMALVLVAIPSSVLAADPFVGTYRLNPAKSKMSGAPPAADVTVTITEAGENLTVTTRGKRTDGASVNSTLMVPIKGGAVRRTEGEGAAYDSATATRSEPHTIQVVTMRQGKEAVRVQLTLSPDGRTLTRTIKGTNAEGRQVDGVSVLERQ